MALAETARPRRRWHHASATLDHFAVVTLRADLDAVRAVVPTRFEPRPFAFADGTTGALVSVVAFVERDFAFRFAPFVRVSGSLVDYRTYGSVDGEPGVYVFATSLDHPSVHLPRLLWRMPWRREPVRIDGRWESGSSHLRITTDGEGGLELDLAGGGAIGDLDGFTGPDEAIEVLTHPMVGWYGDDADLRRYTVWHDVLRPQQARVDEVRVPTFTALGLGARRDDVHSALLVEQASFDIHTPPRRQPRG